MNLLIIVLDDVEVLFHPHFRRDFRVRWRNECVRS